MSAERPSTPNGWDGNSLPPRNNASPYEFRPLRQEISSACRVIGSAQFGGVRIWIENGRHCSSSDSAEVAEYGPRLWEM
jgi:hypothetical protein